MTTTANLAGDFARIYDLGYTRLTPIIPVGAALKPSSSLAGRAAAGDSPCGKIPGVRTPQGWVGTDHTKIESEREDLGDWEEMGAAVGIRVGRGIVALDIDVTDEGVSAELGDLARDMLGVSPVRIGRAPKQLMVYRVEGDEIPYTKVTFQTPTEAKAIVEVLSEGRQFVAAGIHPKTGQPYTWPEGMARREDLPVITQAMLDDYMAMVEMMMPAAERSAGGRGEDVAQDTLEAPSLDELHDLMDQMPNTSAAFPGRTDYINMAYALKAAAGPRHEPYAEEMFLDWCARWDEGENDEAQAKADFQYAKPPYRMGWNWLIEKAEELGYSGRAESLFGDIPMPAAAPAAPAKPKGLMKFLTLEEIEDMPDPRFLIDRILPDKGVGVIFGDSRAKKSFLALDMALSIAHGLPDWHGDKISSDEGDKVLYLAGEGAGGFKTRIRAWNKHRGMDRTTPNFRLFPSCPDFQSAEHIGLLMSSIEEHMNGVKVLIIDTMARALPGIEENSAGDMGKFFVVLDGLSRKYNCVVLFLHHSSKAGDIRGSSAIRGAVDFAHRLSSEPGNEVVNWFCDKMKDGGSDGWEDEYVMHELIVGANADDKLLTSLAATRRPPEERGTRSIPADTIDRVSAYVDQRWILDDPVPTKGRGKKNPPAIIAEALFMPEELVSATLGALMACGAVKDDISISGKKGLKVIQELRDQVVTARADLETAQAAALFGDG